MDDSSSDDDQVVRITVVGEDGCGKTSLLHTYLDGEFDDKYNSSASKLDKTRRSVDQDGNWTVQLEDTRNNQQEDRQRLLAYPFSDLVLICFEMGSAESLSSVTEKWLVEISHHCHNKPPCFLVGLKSDLNATVSMSDIQSVQSANPQCTKIYVLSAKTEGNKVKELFNEAITAGIAQKKKIVAEEHAAEASTSKTGGSSGHRRRGCMIL